MADVAVLECKTANVVGVELKDVELTPIGGRPNDAGSRGGGGGGGPAASQQLPKRPIVWADTVDKSLTQTMVSARLHYSVNYNSSSFTDTTTPQRSDEDGADQSRPDQTPDPPNPAIQNCCVVS